MIPFHVKMGNTDTNYHVLFPLQTNYNKNTLYENTATRKQKLNQEKC